MRLLLTEEEIQDAKVGHVAILDNGKPQVWKADGFVAKAQLKKVVDWGNGQCTVHADTGTGGILTIGWYRRECPKCWQVLLKEVS